MPTNADKINELLDRLELLSKQQTIFQKEISEIREELYVLKYATNAEKPEIKQNPVLETNLPKIESQLVENRPLKEPIQEVIRQEATKKPAYPPFQPKPPKQKSDLEKFIGENLINKIGIAILVLGVAIGVKYSIDNELISPLTRIILGYFMGLGLIGVAIKLKKDYLNLSAVLLSGAMAIMYFITFAAYSFYQLLPQVPTFGLMVMFTIFTVIAALNYEKPVIAHIGLVGAYAVPFLLSDGSGKVGILFTYMAIINIGILAIAIKKYWKSLYFSAFGLTWLIFGSWFGINYVQETHLTLALSFLSIFFVIFYAVFIAYKLVQKEEFAKMDIVMLMLNSALFYGIGYAILDRHAMGTQLLGLFTLANAVVHFGVSSFIFQKKLADKKLFYLGMSLVITFITIAIPVQLEGHWVVLLWSVEAALMFWIGRTRAITFYEKMSYALMALASYCLYLDWLSGYEWEIWQGAEIISPKMLPIFNTHFLCSVVFIASFGFINYLNSTKAYLETPQKWQLDILLIAIPSIFVTAVYFAFYLEISHYFHQLYNSTAHVMKIEDYPAYFQNEDIRAFSALWLINYSLLFFSILALINVYYLKSRSLGIANILFSAISVFVFLTLGLIALGELRATYLVHDTDKFYTHGAINIGIRYISYIFVTISLLTTYKYIKADFLQPMKFNLVLLYDILLFGSILWIGSTELITWIEMSGSADSYKLGLSILWGIYSLLLIILGIYKKKKHLRIGAIVLFAITLVKLFFYDISNLNTIAKTVIFISLGVLLLVISFLYNKYKYLIFDDEEAEQK